MIPIWSRELRCTTGGSNKYYRLEVYPVDTTSKLKYVVRAAWGRVGQPAKMQDKGFHPSVRAARDAANLIARNKINGRSGSRYIQYKTVDHEKEAKKRENQKKEELSTAEGRRFGRFRRLARRK